MIPATTPYEVYYKGTDNEGKPYTWPGPQVIAWDDDGAPLVIPDSHKQARRLQRATDYGNFSHVAPADSPTVAALPGGGWRVEYKNDDGTLWSAPLVAWHIRASGETIPIDCDSTGYADNPTDSSNFVRIFHPEWDTDAAA